MQKIKFFKFGSISLLYEFMVRMPVLLAPFLSLVGVEQNPVEFLYLYGIAMIIWFTADFGQRFLLVKYYKANETILQWRTIENNRGILIIVFGSSFCLLELSYIHVSIILFCLSKNYMLDWILKYKKASLDITILGLINLTLFIVFSRYLLTGLELFSCLTLSNLISCIALRLICRSLPTLQGLHLGHLMKSGPIGLLASVPNILYNIPYLLMDGLTSLDENFYFFYFYRILMAFNFGIASYGFIYFIDRVRFQNAENIKFGFINNIMVIVATTSTFIMLLRMFDVNVSYLFILFALLIIRSLRTFKMQELIAQEFFGIQSFLHTLTCIVTFGLVTVFGQKLDLQILVYIIIISEVVFLFAVKKNG